MEPPLDSDECQNELMQAMQILTELQAELDEVRHLAECRHSVER